MSRWPSGANPAAFPRLCGAHYSAGTAVAVSRVARTRILSTGTTSAIGADGGETSLANLVLLCRHHHRAVHEGGFSCERRPQGEIVFTDARRQPISDGAPLPGFAGDLSAWLDTFIFDGATDCTRENAIDHDSCRAKHGAGERMDWDLAVAVLF